MSLLTTTPSSTQSPASTADVDTARPDWHIAPQQVVLALVLLFEIAIFSVLSEHFLTPENLFTVLTHSVELGLLALALTPIILTGGIDLSVGSSLGLAAVLLGMLWHDAGLPLALAALIAILVATLGGGLNALLITRGRMPPLIVTLGTLALFRGIAEGLTHGQGSYTDFPEEFVFLGQGSLLEIPTQLWLFVPVIIGFYLLVHRSTAGRALSAIGYAPDGALYAGLRVGRLTGGAYVLAGLCAGVAALIYVSRYGEARADAGFGFELSAITAVVLGGTSIFGGRGSIVGTLLGLVAVALLRNGLQMARLPDAVVSALSLRQSNLPAELAGVLTGVLLLVCGGLDMLFRRAARIRVTATPASTKTASEELDMRNSQLAVLCAVIVAAALIIAGGNFMLIRSLKNEMGSGGNTGGSGGGGTGPSNTGGGGAPSGRKLVVAMMPKSKGNSYFIACQKGAEEAAKELNVELLWDGPSGAAAEPAAQNNIVDVWINRKVDVIAVAVENAGGLSTALRRARAAGIKVITWDADANPDARDFFCNQATPDGIGDIMIETAAKQMNNEGKFVVISGSQTAANLGQWRDRIRARMKDFPKMELADVVYCDDSQPIAMDLGKQMLNKHKDLKLIMAICSPAVPGAADAVRSAQRPDVKVIGLGLPSQNRKNVHDGITQAVILWKTADLGYLAVQASKAVVEGRLKAGDTEFEAGRLGKLKIEKPDMIILGKPFVFTHENIDQFDF